MSSILQALKKIETDSAPQEGYTNWPKKIDTKTAINSGARKRWYYRKLASFFLIGLLICMFGVMIWTQRGFITSQVLSLVKPDNADESSHSANSKDSRVFRAKINPDQLPEAAAARTPAVSKQQAAVNTQRKAVVKQGEPVKDSAGLSKPGRRIPSDNRPQMVAAANTPQSRTKASATSLKSQPKKPVVKNQPVEPVVKGPPVKPAKNTIPPQAPPKTNLRASKAIPRTSPARSLKPSNPATKTTASPTREASYSRLEDASFKLQAIAWSTEAAKRLAVINGRIIREGESVGGYTVTQIRQEDVIVNDGSSSWLLEFGLKQ